MRVARFHAPGDIRLEHAEEPRAGSGELTIRVRSCSACGTDVKIWRSGHPNLHGEQVLGHEIAGEIVELGEGVAGWSLGDRVQVIAAVPCGVCHDCLAGRGTVCPNQRSMGYQWPGGFAERMVVPAAVLAVDGLTRIPDGVDYVEASVAEPLACVLNGQEIADVGEGDVVAVLGAGPIGCLHVRLARARGAARVLLLDVNAERLGVSAGLVHPDLAIAVGDQDPVRAVLDATEGRGADVVIVAAASGRAQEQALGMLARGGRMSLFAGLPRDDSAITLDANLIHYRELRVVGVNGSSPAHNKRALDLIASGAVPVADLVTHRLPLDRLLEGLELVARGEAIKVAIEP